MTNAMDLEPQPYMIPLSLDGHEVLSFEPRELSGWGSYFSDEIEQAGIRMYIRIGPRNEGQEFPEVVFVDGKPGVRMGPPAITSEVPLEIREVRMVAESGADASSSVWRVFPWGRIEAAINQPIHRQVLDRWVQPAFSVAEALPGELVSFHIRPAPVKLEKPNLQLDIPDDYRKPDEFYQRVADLFLWLAAITSRPAQEIAEANQVKPSTVHRWISEAKARGLLVLPSERSGLKGRFAQKKELEAAQAAVDDSRERLIQEIVDAGGEYSEGPPPPKE
ncbi:hypothetical protein ACIBCT_38715 [Streptosporangium sp. NPDC050855]|uniref:hypothetical protein n=1 Tax=Streptosporangium sp. NPDC050855 TaxID=3366194 RepID=UPI0037BB85F6